MDNKQKVGPCSVCTKQMTTKNSEQCSWCNQLSHTKCVKGSLGCIDCCIDIIPGYYYHAHELTGNYYNTGTFFNPYDNDLLINQIQTGHTADDHDELEDDMFTNIISEQLNNCRYITPQNVPPARSDELKILSLNIRSLPKHIGHLRENIDHFRKFDVICLNETNCDPSTLANGINDITLDGFHIPFTKKPNRTSNRGGGLTIYVNVRVCDEQNLELLEIPIETHQNSAPFECLFLQIKLKLSNNDHKSYIIGNFYRSPSINPSLSLDQFDDILGKLDRHKNKHIILVGDFNIDLLKYEHDNTSQTLINSTTSHGFSQVISRPTRITDHSATLIDHIYTNQVHNITNTGIITYDISDHLATYVNIALYDRLNSRHMIEKKNASLEQFNFRTENLDNFANLLRDEDWDNVLNESDTQLKYDMFATTYMTHYNTAFCSRAPECRKRQRASPKPWILPWLEEACDRKNRLYAAFIAEPTVINKSKYTKMNKFIKKHINLAKRRYYKTYFTKHCSDSRKQWQMINSLLNRTKPKHQKINLRDSENNFIKEPRDVAEKFNTYFTNIAERLKAQTCSDAGYPLSHMTSMRNPISNSIFISPTHPIEVNKIINDLRNKTTSDSKIAALKSATRVNKFNDTLTDIINSSFITGVFPVQLKIAKVIPIHKSGPKTEVSNYRPISLLSSFSKIFEKIMHNRVVNFLEDNNALYDMQFGFRAGRSCEQALLTANNEILAALSKKQIALLLLIDFSKAFDMVDHDIMLDKLEHYGIRGIANKWFKSYLCDRKQYVSIKGEFSSEQLLRYSVPQGSILGPLLFVIYINDMPNINKFVKFILYADDANIIITGSNMCEVATLFSELAQSLVDWVGSNGLALNVRKTNYMLFTRARNTNLDHFMPKVANIPIERKNVVRFLGVLVDDKLTWSNQIAAIKVKMSKYIGVIFKLKSTLPLTVRLTIYNSLVQSHLNYCSLLWGTSCKSNINKLFTAQKKAIRGVMPGYANSYYKDGKLPTHTKQFFSKHDLLTVHNIILKNIMIFFYKLHHSPETIPQTIKHLIPPTAPNPENVVDYSSDWYTIYNSYPYNKSIFFKGPILFTDIVNEEHERYSHTTNSVSVKKITKKILLNTQKAGNEEEWETSNFKLMELTGLRRSKRNIKQNNTAQC